MTRPAGPRLVVVPTAPAPAPEPAHPTHPALADTAVFRPVKAGNTFEQTVERLAQAIKLGAVPLGDRLPAERDLAERLNVSRVTLREAIKALQQAGYVESRRGRSGGTFVIFDATRTSPRDAKTVARRMGRDEVLDALAFRSVVEPGAAELAAGRRLDANARAYLSGCLEDVLDGDGPSRRVADSRLHRAIGELSGSASLAASVTEVQVRLNELLAAIPVLARNMEHSDDQHEQIVASILAGRTRKARQAMEEHVEATAALLRGFLA
jgi:DNA-binding FadR family transcriptional regulator